MKHPGGGGAAGGGHSAKHTRSKKHVQGKGKHHPVHHKQAHHAGAGAKVTVKAHHAKHPRGLAIGDWLPVCAAEALAMSLRLAGGAVSDEDVVRLHVLAGGAEDAAASILSVLEAASVFGLGGVRPRWAPVADALVAGVGVLAQPELAEAPQVIRRAAQEAGHGLILGVDVPGPHAVLAAADGWWSWGSLWSPWTTAVSEAWAVSWSWPARSLIPHDPASRGALAVDMPPAQAVFHYAGDAA